ncbi:unnamed protein product [Phytophthora fragariaefolia]|uniref:Unnamed protein product n=1 Tax=Phytophthora fragariaefolia TaxID=1490495 RepID=A0A9W6Y7Y9_9STRA|nr:unnamed protein product [Phytophthora fragariaefolia]
MNPDSGPESAGSDDEVVATSDSEWEPTSPSLSEGEEGVYDDISDIASEFVSLSAESRAQELIESDPSK